MVEIIESTKEVYISAFQAGKVVEGLSVFDSFEATKWGIIEELSFEYLEGEGGVLEEFYVFKELYKINEFIEEHLETNTELFVE